MGLPYLTWSPGYVAGETSPCNSDGSQVGGLRLESGLHPSVTPHMPSRLLLYIIKLSSGFQVRINLTLLVSPSLVLTHRRSGWMA
jgi:hypothetical protein